MGLHDEDEKRILAIGKSIAVVTEEFRPHALFACYAIKRHDEEGEREGVPLIGTALSGCEHCAAFALAHAFGMFSDDGKKLFMEMIKEDLAYHVERFKTPVIQ